MATEAAAASSAASGGPTAGPQSTSAEREAMRRAIELAVRGLGRTSPNPVVGCVILDAAGRRVGEGWHQRAGGPHAEVHALAEAGEDARGGTALVTLEPCNHTGRTGPCAQALIDAGIARVHYAVADPNPPAAGGAAALAAAGVAVHRGLLAEEATRANAAWLTAAARGLPHVTWKYAATLDGRSAAADGSSRWITSEQARADVHRLRAESDAVLVGSGTARTDDPQLAVRALPGAVTESKVPRADQPLRVVLDTEARAVRPGARVLDGAAPTLIAVAEDAEAAAAAELEAAGAELLRLPRAAAGQGLDLRALLTALYDRDVRSVLLEGGPRLAGAFVEAGLVDRVEAYLAPVLLGAGPAALGPAGIGTIAQALRLRTVDTAQLGPDLRLTAVPVRPASPAAAAPATPAEES